MHYCNLFKPAITAHSHCRSLWVIFSLTAVVVCEPISLSLSQFVSPSPSHYHAWDELWTLNKILWTKLSLTHSASLLLSLTRSGCFWLSLVVSGSLSLIHSFTFCSFQPTLTQSGSLWLSQELIGSQDPSCSARNVGVPLPQLMTPCTLVVLFSWCLFFATCQYILQVFLDKNWKSPLSPI